MYNSIDIMPQTVALNETERSYDIHSTIPFM